MAEPLVTAIILNTNRRADTLECLASLAQSTYPRLSILVLDNASQDGSVEAIQQQFPQVEVLAVTENRGYAGNNNVGIAAALSRGADWVFVLNEDTVLDPGCIAHLVAAGQADPQVGMLGPMIYHASEPEVIQSAGGMLGPRWCSTHLGQNQVDRGQFPQPHRVEWVSGCAIFARRALIEQVGAIDQRFFYYWEETEWCLRARRAGWQVLHVPHARLWHKGVQRDYRPSPNVTYYAVRNRLFMYALHHAPIQAWVAALWEIGRILLSWSVMPKWRLAKREHRQALLQALGDFIARRWGQRPMNKPSSP